MRRLNVILFLILWTLCLLPLKTIAAIDPLVISRVIVGTKTSASDEVVAIYNNSDTTINISGLALDYKSATGKDWTTRGTVPTGTQLAAWHEFILASLQPADGKLSAGMAQTGGNLRLAANDKTTLDQLAWGTGDSPVGQSVAAPKTSEQITRLPIGSGPQLQDTGNNQADFANQLIDGSQTTSPNSQPVSPTNPQISGLSLQLTELLPDPVSPQTDSNDEFVELYNPNDTAVSLAGWKLRDGGGKVFTFGGISLAPQQYFAIYSKQTKISLNNSGDTITLLDPSGAEIDSTPNYGNAKAGLSWGLTEDGWTWTISPTPNDLNSAALPPTINSTKNSSSKSTSSSKSKQTSKSSPKTSKTKAVPTSSLAASGEDPATTASTYNIWSWLLIGAGVITIGYGAYEYRPEIKAAYAKFRAKLPTRRKNS